MSPRVKHIIGVALAIAAPAVIYAFGPSGPWGHIAAAGTVIAIFTNLRMAMTGSTS
jgi:hypothetical protein